MVLIPVFWTQYTAKAQGRRLKFVPCENCSAEYVYVMEREATGAGTSVYMLNDQGAAGHAASAAEETLSDVLENDFDPVPCPVCGCYQRHMFPKLLGNTGLGVRLILLAVIVLGCLAGVNAVYRSLLYLRHPADDDLRQLVATGAVLLALGVTGFGLSLLNKALVGRFNPNAGDPEERIALGRRRAVTREEFEKGRAAQGAGDVDRSSAAFPPSPGGSFPLASLSEGGKESHEGPRSS